MKMNSSSPYSKPYPRHPPSSTRRHDDDHAYRIHLAEYQYDNNEYHGRPRQAAAHSDHPPVNFSYSSTSSPTNPRGGVPARDRHDERFKHHKGQYVPEGANLVHFHGHGDHHLSSLRSSHHHNSSSSFGLRDLSHDESAASSLMQHQVKREDEETFRRRNGRSCLYTCRYFAGTILLVANACVLISPLLQLELYQVKDVFEGLKLPQRTKSIIKKTEGGTNRSWKIVDWAHPITDEEEAKFSCNMTSFESTGGESQMICVHTFDDDLLTKHFRVHKRWQDCDILPKLWHEGGQSDGVEVFYLEIGANIGSCVMEMLLSTDARIIAFEPHPMNLYNIKKTVSQLDESYQDRLFLFPVGLGNVNVVSTIYSGNNNMGNSVLGKLIGDSPEQQFDQNLQFDVHVQRLDSILEAKGEYQVKLVKMDAQGFECNILDGMGDALASKIDRIKFEYADKWLHGQGCTDLLLHMNKFGFHIYEKYFDEHFMDEVFDYTGAVLGQNVVVDLFASKNNSSGLNKSQARGV